MIVTRRDPEHVYADDSGAVLPGTTSVLETVTPWLGRFDAVPPDRLEFKRQLGAAVHAAIALEFADDLDESSLDPAVLPYLEARRRFCRESGFTPTLSESVVWHPRYRYAGTLDDFGHMPDHVWWLIDSKTIHESHADLSGPQTAAYLEALRAHNPQLPPIVKRASLHLRDDGTYRFVPHTNPRDFAVFLAALEIHNFNAQRTRR